MKNTVICAAAAILLASPLGFAQTAAPQDWEVQVRQFDTAFWDAYNQCDIKKLVDLNTDDMEFYHDEGGLRVGQAKFAAAMENNICGNPAQRVRRAAVAESVHIFPMRANGKLYGAVISGEHQFYNYTKGGPEMLVARALFTHMLVLKDGAWKVSRVLSYDHQPVADVKLTEVKLAAPVMERLAGTYKNKEGMPIVVKTAGDHLLATAGPGNFELYPLTETTYFMKKRDIKVTFSVDQAGKGQSMVVREHGAIVAEAARASAPSEVR